MKQYTYMLFLAVASLAFFSSCENKENKEFLDDYDSMIYFLKDGDQSSVLYRVGEPTTLSFNISKTGSNYGASGSAEVLVMTQSELDEYNVANGTKYKVLPQNCYEILSSPKLSFAPNVTYVLLDIKYETAVIDLLQDPNYVHALKLVSETTKVNPTKDILLVKPYIEDPFIYFDNTGTSRIIIEDGAQEVLEYKIEIKHNFKNLWNFSSTIGTNKDLLDEFNEANGVNYLMVPEQAYVIKNDGKVDFTAKVDYGNMELEIDGSKISYGNYLLPLSILDVSKKEFKIDPARKDNVYIVSYAPAASKLSPVNLTVDMLATNAQEPSEGPIANLLDGNVETFFHSAWSIAVDGDHYLQVNLKEEISAFNFQFSTRHNNSGGNPAKIVLQGSTDGVKFFNIETIEENLPTGTAQEYKSHVIVTAPTKHLRLVIPASRGGSKYFTMSEFSMSGLK